MKRGEMLTGRSVSADCGLRIAKCGFKAAVRRFRVGRVVLVAGVLCALVGLLVGLRFGFGVNAAADAGGQDKSEDGVWQRTRTLAGEWAGRSGVPESAVVFKLDESALRSVLAREGKRDGETEGLRDGEKEGMGVVVWLPMPGGGFERFRVVEAPVMKPELAALLPDIKSYRGWGIDDGRLTMRCDLSPLGFHATVTDGAELMAIHPVQQNEREHYVSYSSRSYAAAADAALCLVNDSKVIRKITPRFSQNSSVGDQFRYYDIAIATTGEYAQVYGGGTVSGTLSSLNAWLNPLNVIYERELSIGIVLTANNQQVIYTNSATDPFTNGNTNVMVDQVRAVLGGSGLNYDLGLVLGTPLPGAGSGGSAYVGVVCETTSDSFGPYKGGGAVLVNGSVGNTDSAYLMAHEIGHQFGATHTQNANCGVRVGDTAFETGSGQSLMSNAGGCGGDDIATARSGYFHSGSFEQIIGYLNFQGAACATLVSNGGNVPPTVILLNNTNSYVIPKQTPFALTATATDTPGETLTYSWEQVDAGNSGFANPPYNDAGDPPLTTRPIFRPFDPATNNGVRTFPVLSGILSGQNSASFEFLPNINRHLNFRVTARDQRGGVTNSSVELTVDQSAGPFAVTSPNTNLTWLGNRQQTVTWDKAGTDGGQVLCANVRISLSTDGGITFPTVLAASTPNDGSEVVTIPPNVGSGTSRIKVEAFDNIFFDISNTNFVLTPCPVITVNQVTLPNGFVGTGYSQTITSSGGAAPYTFTVSAGTLPNGITLSAGGVLFGTPTTIGVFSFTVTATDNNGCLGSRVYTVVISGTGLMYYPLNPPVKLLDTRSGQTACSTPAGPITGGTTLTQAATACSSIPATAQAVTGTVTAYAPSVNGFITLFPSDAAQPLASTNNLRAGITLGNVFTVGLGAADKAFKVFLVPTAHLEVDITGYFAPPAAGGLYFHSLPAPVRLLDTRVEATGCYAPGTALPAGADTLQQGNGTCGIPDTAKVLVGNATTVSPQVEGNLTLFRSDLVPRPPITTGNYQLGQTLNSPFFVALSPSGQFKIYTYAQTHLVIDVMGYYSPDATDATSGQGLLYTSMTPVRLLDTRSGQSACTMPGAPMTGGVEYTQPAGGSCGIASLAKAVVGNATTVLPSANGFLTLWPSDAVRPLIATSNYASGVNFNRYFTVGLGMDGAFKRYALSTTDLVIDVSGYFAP